VAPDAPPPTEQGPERARRTEPSSATTRPRLLCARAAATWMRVNPARNARAAHRLSRPGSRKARGPSLSGWAANLSSPPCVVPRSVRQTAHYWAPGANALKVSSAAAALASHRLAPSSL
jgi:hypothetical protein